MHIVSCVLIHTTRRAFHLRIFIDQDTIWRSSDFQHVHTRHVQSIQIWLNDLTVFPLVADARKRERQSCSPLHPKHSYTSFSINFVVPEHFFRFFHFCQHPMIRVESTTTSATDFDGLVVLTDSCSRVFVLSSPCMSCTSVCHACSTKCRDSSHPLWCFRFYELGVSNVVIKCSLRCRRYRFRALRVG